MSESRGTAETSTEEAATERIKTKPDACATELLPEDKVAYYQELGLGRGVNVTDPQMWRNKSFFVVRKVSENILGTAECGVLESYRKEVATLSMQQQKIRIAVSDPTKQVEIGVDEHYSTSTSISKLIVGKKIETCTIAFKFHFDDLPLSNDIIKANIKPPDQFLFNGDSSFECGLYLWILKRISNREGNVDSEKLKGDQAVNKLYMYLKKNKNSKKELSHIVHDCKEFVNSIGLTHYVTSITLGACHYHTVCTSSKLETLGVKAEVGASPYAKGGVSGFMERKWFERTEEQQKIGRIDDNEEKVKSEAVISFQIQPLHKLVSIQFIQLALRKAIKEFINAKEDSSEGPFLILCEMDKGPDSTTDPKQDKKIVYWRVNDKYNLIGTEDELKATAFYIMPTGDPSHPSDFYICSWCRDERKKAMNIKDIYRDHHDGRKGGPKLPHYLSTNGNVLGRCNGPLKMSTAVEKKQARFTLHNRVQSSFTCMQLHSTPVSPSEWIEGEQFYINCSRRSFMIDGYIAMKMEDKQESTKRDEVETRYKTVTVASVTGKNPVEIGLLFRLQHKKVSEKKTTATDEETESNYETADEGEYKTADDSASEYESAYEQEIESESDKAALDEQEIKSESDESALDEQEIESESDESALDEEIESESDESAFDEQEIESESDESALDEQEIKSESDESALDEQEIESESDESALDEQEIKSDESTADGQETNEQT